MLAWLPDPRAHLLACRIGPDHEPLVQREVRKLEQQLGGPLKGFWDELESQHQHHRHGYGHGHGHGQHRSAVTIK